MCRIWVEPHLAAALKIWIWSLILQVWYGIEDGSLVALLYWVRELVYWQEISGSPTEYYRNLAIQRSDGAFGRRKRVASETVLQQMARSWLEGPQEKKVMCWDFGLRKIYKHALLEESLLLLFLYRFGHVPPVAKGVRPVSWSGLTSGKVRSCKSQLQQGLSMATGTVGAIIALLSCYSTSLQVGWTIPRHSGFATTPSKRQWNATCFWAGQSIYQPFFLCNDVALWNTESFDQVKVNSRVSSRHPGVWWAWGRQEDFGLECVSAGNRGPMSMDKDRSPRAVALLQSAGEPGEWQAVFFGGRLP